MEQLANNASTTLNGAINNSTTSVVVTDGSVFPSSGNFRVLCGTEIMLCTARSTNTLTVVRGQEGTTADSHSSTNNIELVYTKGSIEQLLTEYNQYGGYASRPASPRKGTLYTATDLPARWFYNGSSWDLVHPVILPNAKQWSATGWTAQNQSTATFTDKNGILEFSTMPSATAIRGYSRSLPSTPYTCTFLLPPNMYSGTSTSMYIGWRESGTGKIKAMYNAGNLNGSFGVENWNTFNSFNATVMSQALGSLRNFRWAKLQDDNTNWMFHVSVDGVNFTKIHSVARNNFMTTAADQIFFGYFTNISYNNTVTVTPNAYLYGYWEN